MAALTLEELQNMRAAYWSRDSGDWPAHSDVIKVLDEMIALHTTPDADIELLERSFGSEQHPSVAVLLAMLKFSRRQHMACVGELKAKDAQIDGMSTSCGNYHNSVQALAQQLLTMHWRQK